MEPPSNPCSKLSRILRKVSSPLSLGKKANKQEDDALGPLPSEDDAISRLPSFNEGIRATHARGLSSEALAPAPAPHINRKKHPSPRPKDLEELRREFRGTFGNLPAMYVDGHIEDSTSGAPIHQLDAEDSSETSSVVEIIGQNSSATRADATPRRTMPVRRLAGAKPVTVCRVLDRAVLRTLTNSARRARLTPAVKPSGGEENRREVKEEENRMDE